MRNYEDNGKIKPKKKIEIDRRGGFWWWQVAMIRINGCRAT